ncbi:MCE family protein [Nocardia sp. BSTN01]|uniref:MCE family protein n=1 Tax=Nocardia sp. BSTN01 TaxID=2783665 RepID=UPI00281607E3|nr:MCE family protein [Nocardia sp. BSTN01]
MSARRMWSRTLGCALVCCALAPALAGCGEWRGVNSLPLPGTKGEGQGSFEVRIQMPNVTGIQPNSRVRVADVNVGTITRIDREDWHAVVTVRLDGDVRLPENATAKIGQTSLLGSQHIELAPPVNEPPTGRLHGGDLIPLERASQYPTTEQALSAMSLVLNGGGIGRLQEIDAELNAALSGRESDVHNLIGQLATFTSSLDEQKTEIIEAMAGLDHLAATVNSQNEVLTKSLDAIPPALGVLNDQRDKLIRALTAIGDFAGKANDVVVASHDDVAQNLRNLQPALRALGDAGRDLTRSLGIYATYPWPAANLDKWIRGDYGNLTAVIDLTLGRIDNSLLQGTPLEGQLTALETALGRTKDRQPGLGTPNPLSGPVSDGGR